MVLMLWFNATHQPDIVGAQQRMGREYLAHGFVEYQIALKPISAVVNVLPNQLVSLVPLSQSVTLMVVTLRFNATHQLDTVGAQRSMDRKLVVQQLVENQLALKVDPAIVRSDVTPLQCQSIKVSISQSVTLMEVTLRFNAKLQLDTVGAQISMGRELAVQWHVEHQLVLMVDRPVVR